MNLTLKLSRDKRMVEIWLDKSILCVVHIDDLILTSHDRDELLTGNRINAVLVLKEG